MEYSKKNIRGSLRYSTAGYCYLRNAKAACSTILYGLWTKEHREGRFNELPVKNHVHKKERPWPLDLSIADIPEDAFVFSLVRNPFSRALSCYLDKMTRRNGTHRKFCETYGISRRRAISFEEFLTRIGDTPPELDNHHWCPQTYNLLVGAIRIDFVGHLEHISEDLPFLADRVGFPTDAGTRTKHATGSETKFQEYMSDKSIDLIRKKYTNDFRLFGYSDDPSMLAPTQRRLSFPRDYILPR